MLYLFFGVIHNRKYVKELLNALKCFLNPAHEKQKFDLCGCIYLRSPVFHGLVHINPLWLVFKDILLCSIFLLYIYKKKGRKLLKKNLFP